MSLLLLVSGIFSIQFSKGLIEFSISPKNTETQKTEDYYYHAKKLLAIINSRDVW